MKKGLLGLIALILLVSVVGCGSASYASDVPAEDVATAALNALDGADHYMDGTSAYFSYYFEDADGADRINDCVMMFHQSETNVNEICIFRTASPKDAERVEDAVEDYIEEQEEYLYGFAKNYSPEDLKKIENADTEVIGCYVIGYVLSPKDEQTALAAVRQALKEN